MPESSIKLLPLPDPEPSNLSDVAEIPSASGGIVSWMKRTLKLKPGGTSLRDALEEYIENAHAEGDEAVAIHERTLISNVLKMRHLTVVDVMIPRADIVAIDIDAQSTELFALLSEKQFSRIPVYRDTLDDIAGAIHLKDVVACLAAGQPVNIVDLVRDAPIVSPALPVLDLLLQMKESKKHMAFVVDEYGGIDGLVTIVDVIEAIIGELEDEFDPDQSPQIVLKGENIYLADARVDIAEFEQYFGPVLSAEERDNVDTLGGLIFFIAGRVPARGELIRHDSGIVFEIVDADPRKVNSLRIRNAPSSA